jgi:hypothetical protein
MNASSSSGELLPRTWGQHSHATADRTAAAAAARHAMKSVQGEVGRDMRTGSTGHSLGSSTCWLHSAGNPMPVSEHSAAPRHVLLRSEGTATDLRKKTDTSSMLHAHCVLTAAAAACSLLLHAHCKLTAAAAAAACTGLTASAAPFMSMPWSATIQRELLSANRHTCRQQHTTQDAWRLACCVARSSSGSISQMQGSSCAPCKQPSQSLEYTITRHRLLHLLLLQRAHAKPVRCCHPPPKHRLSQVTPCCIALHCAALTLSPCCRPCAFSPAAKLRIASFSSLPGACDAARKIRSSRERGP